MTTYNSYEEAKIANPDKAIIRFNRQDEFKAVGDDDLSAYLTTWTKCDPADYCKTLGWLRANHGLERGGDVIIGHSSGDVITITHDRIADYDDKCFILRAAALENQMNIDKVETQTEHQEEMSAFSGEVEWKNGDECIYTGQPDLKCKFVATHPNNEQCAIVWEGGGDINLGCVAIDCLSKPETPQQREDRERLEAAGYLLGDWFNAIGKDMPEWSSINEDVKAHYLRIVDETNYRKVVK